MALKRPLENCQDDINAKISKLPDGNVFDVTLDCTSLSKDLKCSLEYDSVLNSFSISLDKERKDGNRFICFGEEEMRNIVKLLPAIEKLLCRYASKRSPQIIDIPFEASSATVTDLITVVSLKENMYKRGQFDIDIRKCMKKEDSYQYTSEGVRFEQKLLGKLRDTLIGYQTLIEQAIQQSRIVISTTMAKCIAAQIQELSDPRNHCQGCEINHPSQKEHMGQGGCLSEQRPSWEEAVTQYWQAAKILVTEDDVLTLANQAATLAPELQKAFIPGLVLPNTISDHDLKERVLRRGETEDNHMFNN